MNLGCLAKFEEKTSMKESHLGHRTWGNKAVTLLEDFLRTSSHSVRGCSRVKEEKSSIVLPKGKAG